MSGLLGDLFDLDRDGKLDPLERTVEYSALYNMQHEDETDDDWDDEDNEDDWTDSDDFDEEDD